MVGSTKAAEAWFGEAVAHYAAGRLPQAEAVLRRGLEVAPDHVDALQLLGLLLCRTRRADEALMLFDRAGALAPDSAAVRINKGAALRAAGQLEAAVQSYREAADLDPAMAEAPFNMGNVLTQLGRLEPALAAYDRAIAMKADFAEALNNRGNALSRLGRFAAAVESYDVVLRLAPQAAEAHLNRGLALSHVDRDEEALQSIDRALELAPSHALAHKARGNLLRQLGRIGEAVESYWQELTIAQQDVRLASGRPDAWRALLAVNTLPLVYRSQAELEATREQVNLALQSVSRRLAEEAPQPGRPADKLMAMHLDGFALAYHQHNDRPQMQAFSAAISRLLGADAFPRPSGTRRPGPIRVGIAAQRLRDHNGANWALGWLSQLPADYEFFTYAFEPSSDPVARGFAALGKHRVLPFGPDSYESSMRTILEDDLDVLMLPEIGMTPASRVLSLYRLAPVQFTGWGHPVTSGSANIDHYLSSDLMEPAGAEAHYSEQLVRLPNLGLFLTSNRNATPAGDFGLPCGRVLYGCLQSLFKYIPKYDHLLPAIAAEVPEALFVFLEGKPSYMTAVTRERLERAFAVAGLDASRHVVFLPRVSKTQYLALQRRMDVLVDSIGWSGGNTSISALEAGVPIVSLPGAFMRGRHTSAMLRMIGCEDLIAVSEEDFVARLVALGRHRDLRRETCQRIVERSPRLHEDRSVIDAVDRYLKAQLRH